MKYLLNRVHAILQSSVPLTLLELDRRSIYQHAFLHYYTGAGEGEGTYTFIYRLSCFASDSIKREEQVYTVVTFIFEKKRSYSRFDRRWRSNNGGEEGRKRRRRKKRSKLRKYRAYCRFTLVKNTVCQSSWWLIADRLTLNGVRSLESLTSGHGIHLFRRLVNLSLEYQSRHTIISYPDLPRK